MLLRHALVRSRSRSRIPDASRTQPIFCCNPLAVPGASPNLHKLFPITGGPISLVNWLGKLVSRSSNRSNRRQALRAPSRWDRLVLEQLEERLALSVTASVVGTTLTVNLGGANDTATITGVSLNSVTVTGTRLSPAAFSGFFDIQVGGTGSAAGQSVHFNGSGGVQDEGPGLAANGISVTNVAGVFVDTSVSSTFGSITFTGAATITAGGIQTGPGGISTSGANATGPGITLSASGAVTLNGRTSTANVTGGTSVGPNSIFTGSINVTSSGGSITGTGQLVTGNATANGSPSADSATSGSIILNVGGAVTLSATNVLVVGSATVTSAGAGDTTKVGDIAIKAGTGIGSPATPLSTQGGTLSAQTGTNGIFISNTGNLTINGGVISGVNGIQDIGASGNIALTNAGTISITAVGNIVKTPGNITLTASGASSNIQTGGNNDGTSGNGAINAGGTVTATTGQDLLLGAASGFGDVDGGSVVINAGRDLFDNSGSFIDAHGTGTVTVNTGRNITVTNTSGRISSQSGAIAMSTGAGGVFTISGGGNVLSSLAGSGAPITISADDMAISGLVNAASSLVTLQQAGTTVRPIDLGAGTTAGDLGLSDAELAQITAGILRIGRSDNSGSITLTAPVTAHAGYSTLSLLSGGAILDSNNTEPDIAVSNLAVRAASGISLDTAVSNLAFSNSGGAVSIRNAGSVTIASVNGLASSSNSGTTTTLSSSSPITFAVNTTSAGTLSATTSETASETGTPLPPPDDNITINSGVAVESTGGDVNLTSGDSIVIQSTSTVKSDTGAVNLTIGSGDNDNDAALTANGTLSAGMVKFTTAGDIFMDTLPSALSNRPGQTLALVSTGGGIFDNTTPDGASDDTDVTAAAVALSAVTGIGTASDPLETVVGALSAQTGTGGIFISNTGNLTITGGAISGVNGVKVASSGILSLTNAGSVTATTSGDFFSAPGGVTVTTSSGNILLGGKNGSGFDNFIGAANSSSGTVTLSAAGNLLIGNAGNNTWANIIAGGSIGLSAGGNINIDESSVVSAHGTGSITATAGGNISLLATNQPGAELATQGGAIALTTGAGGTFTANSGPNIFGFHSIYTTRNSANGNITISADHFVLEPADDDVVAGSGVVTIQPVTASQPIQLGTTTDAELDLSNAELGRITASTLRIGSAAGTGNLTVTAAVSTPNAPTLSLQTGSSIGDNAAADTIFTTNLDARAAAGISLDTAVTNLAFRNTTSGNIRIANARSVTLTAVDTLDGTAGNQLGNFASGGTTTLNVSGAITYAIAVTSQGDLSSTTSETSTETSTPLPPPDENIYVNGGVTVQSTGGNVTLSSADGIFAQSGSVLMSASGAINLSIGQGDVDNDAGLATNGTLTSPIVRFTDPGDIFLDSLSSALTNRPGQTLSIASTNGGIFDNTAPDGANDDRDVTAGNLALSAVTGIGTLADPLETAVGHLAVRNASSGSVFIANTGAMTLTGVDTLNGTAGNQLGNFAPGGTTTFSASGAVTYAIAYTSQGDLSTTTSETASETGTPLPSPDDNITINGGVTVESTGGNVNLTSADSLISQSGSTVKSDSGDITLAGGTGDNDNDATLSLNGAINAGINSTVRLSAAGSVSQTATGTVTAANLAVLANGSIDLAEAANSITGVFAASDATSGAFVRFLGSDGITVGTIAGNASVPGATGMTTNNGDVDLIGGSGALTLTQPVNAGTATVRLNSTGGISQTAAGPLSAANLAVLAGGSIDLAEAASSIAGIFAASDSASGASIRFRDGGGFTIGTITGDATAAGATGVTTNNGNVDLIGGSGALTLTQPVNAGTATVRLNSAGGVAQTAAGPLSAANLAVLANGSVDLAEAANSISGMFAASDAASGASVRFRDGGGFTIGTIAGDAAAAGATGVTTNNGDLSVVAPNLVIGASMNASGGAVTLSPTNGDVNLVAGIGITGSSITQTSGASLSTYPGTLTAGAGGIQLTGNNFSLTGPVSDTGSFTLSDTGTATLSGALSGSGTITKNGAGSLLLSGPLPATLALTVNGGTTTIAANAGTGIRRMNFTNLGIAAGAKLVLAQSSATNGDYSRHANRTVANISAGGFSVATGGTLDMGDNDLILHYAPANQAAANSQIRGLLASGFDGASWDTSGINSSTANYDANFGAGTRTLGYADNNDLGYSSFDGVDTSDGNEVLVKFTYYGDSDLNGMINGTDFSLFGAGRSRAGTGWDFGDYDYSGGRPNGTDFSLFGAGLSSYRRFGSL